MLTNDTPPPLGLKVDPTKYKRMKERLVGVSEKTTTGSRGWRDAINVNDSITKSKPCDADVQAANPLTLRLPAINPLFAAVRPSAAATIDVKVDTNTHTNTWRGQIEASDLNFFMDVDTYLDLIYMFDTDKLDHGTI